MDDPNVESHEGGHLSLGELHIHESNMSSINDVQVCNESDDHCRVSTSIDAEIDMVLSLLCMRYLWKSWYIKFNQGKHQ